VLVYADFTCSPGVVKEYPALSNVLLASRLNMLTLHVPINPLRWIPSESCQA